MLTGLWMLSFERGNMKSLVTLLATVIAECGDLCSVDTTLDIKTVERRVENEGIKFLTLLLPAYEESLLDSLRDGCVNPSSFSGFQKRGVTPVFLGGFMDLIFDRASGKILTHDQYEDSVLEAGIAEAIRSIRQITLLFKKVELECSPEITAKAFGDYVSTDEEVKEWTDAFLASVRQRIGREKSPGYFDWLTLTSSGPWILEFLSIPSFQSTAPVQLRTLVRLTPNGIFALTLSVWKKYSLTGIIVPPRSIPLI